MENYTIYQDIAERTGGDIYIGVVGPVRTGKSTFIKNFMETVIIPNIKDEYKKERAKDELPQSSNGRTIMTTEPKFIPNEAVEIILNNNIKMKTRLVDCVGYLVNNAIGYLEDDLPRMVKTPWQEEEMPFEVAAELGTKKVIVEHSTVGIIITTDGSITDIPRQEYEAAETRVVKELKEINKPFIMLMNTQDPYGEYAIQMAQDLSNRYEATVIPVNCLELNLEDINNIFSKLLYEFMIERVEVVLPKWVRTLDFENPIKQKIFSGVKNIFENCKRLKDIGEKYKELENIENVKNVILEEINLGVGKVSIKLELEDYLFYDVLSEITSTEIRNEGELFGYISDLSKVKKDYDKMAYAIHEVNEKGYGIVTPNIEDLILEEPEIVKQGNKYGVKLKAMAPSIHMIKINTQTEVSPIVGSEKQSEELLNYLLAEFENDPKKIWNSNIFGKNLHELVNEGLQNKLAKMPEDAQMKLQETLQRIVNEGSGGLICIIL